jgi:hypothetical protein
MQWERVLQLRGRVGEGKVKPNFAQFVSVFTVEVMGVFDYFDRFSDAGGG